MTTSTKKAAPKKAAPKKAAPKKAGIKSAAPTIPRTFLLHVGPVTKKGTANIPGSLAAFSTAAKRKAFIDQESRRRRFMTPTTRKDIGKCFPDISVADRSELLEIAVYCVDDVSWYAAA